VLRTVVNSGRGVENSAMMCASMNTKMCLFQCY